MHIHRSCGQHVSTQQVVLTMLRTHKTPDHCSFAAVSAAFGLIRGHMRLHGRVQRTQVPQSLRANATETKDGVDCLYLCVASSLSHRWRR